MAASRPENPPPKVRAIATAIAPYVQRERQADDRDPQQFAMRLARFMAENPAGWLFARKGKSVVDTLAFGFIHTLPLGPDELYLPKHARTGAGGEGIPAYPHEFPVFSQLGVTERNHDLVEPKEIDPSVAERYLDAAAAVLYCGVSELPGDTWVAITEYHADTRKGKFFVDTCGFQPAPDTPAWGLGAGCVLAPAGVAVASLVKQYPFLADER